MHFEACEGVVPAGGESEVGDVVRFFRSAGGAGAPGGGGCPDGGAVVLVPGGVGGAFGGCGAGIIVEKCTYPLFYDYFLPFVSVM